MGAWVETYIDENLRDDVIVAPYVGAWVETQAAAASNPTAQASHLTWVRGLKLLLILTVLAVLLGRTLRGCVG